ncbi:hypothetical protein [Ligilactobacillus salivarius]|uniref:Uncharacterized protein n=1 Tax=Ligilactobacillus salivarius TaxID=1624 RepID=A0A1V9TL88_9LACO|nr:hypothetical protein [Ligilactobacillus salivarius]OQR18382.1 hypothetical protein B6U39_10980 [Ligilactobacillus salivarius]OQR19162.1 hypothetical protein B6U38_10685 [Ligilactobacillus salivarius]OQR23934.1 hypothetical protein B6U37_10465 [Ligilactobacillus salivarius]
MSYMDYNQFKAIMAENGYQKSKAVDVYLNKAMHYNKLIKSIKANIKDKEPVVKLKMEKFIKKYDDARVEAVWGAINVAKLEKCQGWRFVEDGEEFILQLQIKYQGNMKQATEFEQKQVELSTLYEQAYKKQLVKEN